MISPSATGRHDFAVRHWQACSTVATDQPTRPDMAIMGLLRTMRPPGTVEAEG